MVKQRKSKQGLDQRLKACQALAWVQARSGERSSKAIPAQSSYSLWDLQYQAHQNRTLPPDPPPPSSHRHHRLSVQHHKVQTPTTWYIRGESSDNVKYRQWGEHDDYRCPWGRLGLRGERSRWCWTSSPPWHQEATIEIQLITTKENGHKYLYRCIFKNENTCFWRTAEEAAPLSMSAIWPSRPGK